MHVIGEIEALMWVSAWRMPPSVNFPAPLPACSESGIYQRLCNERAMDHAMPSCESTFLALGSDISDWMLILSATVIWSNHPPHGKSKKRTGNRDISPKVIPMGRHHLRKRRSKRS